jgi:hypothetical protein
MAFRLVVARMGAVSTGGMCVQKTEARGAEFVVFEICGSCSELAAVIQELKAATKAAPIRWALQCWKGELCESKK